MSSVRLETQGEFARDITSRNLQGVVMDVGRKARVPDMAGMTSMFPAWLVGGWQDRLLR